MGRAALIAPIYMILQLPRRTARMSPPAWWALAPPSHPYHWYGGYFLLRYSTLANSFLLGSGMLYVARTFLIHVEVQATNQPTVGAKLHNLFEIWEKTENITIFAI